MDPVPRTRRTSLDPNRKEITTMKTPPIVPPREWEAARGELLVKEKELTRARDALAAGRRRMPWMAAEKDYRFEGPDRTVGLLDLFEGRPQLVMHHFTWIKDVDSDGVERPRDTGCGAARGSRGLYGWVCPLLSTSNIQRTGGLASSPGSCRTIPAEARTYGNGSSEMRVLLSTYGSRGDVEPMAGLAVRLRAFGAEVRVCAPPDLAELLARVGALLAAGGMMPAGVWL